MNDTLRRQAREARARIVVGSLRGPALWELLRSVPYLDRDLFTDELLGIDPPPPDVPDLPRGAVPYLPCGVDEILAMVRDLPLRASDELVDLGAGLGRVVMLGHLLSGARARGIEIQPHLVERARQTCSALALPNTVSFEHASATDAPLDGSVLFLYAPFNGAMLAHVVERLAERARQRPFTICAVGLELPDAAWLTERRSSSRALAIYDAR